jgi:glycosyltransferase involved in cell wall biosynthesis
MTSVIGGNPRRSVIIYRDRPLPLSETFIASQGAHLRRYAPLFAGSRRTDRPSISVEPLVCLRDQGGLLSEVMFKAARRVPRAWRERLAATNPALVHAHFGPDGCFAMALASTLGLPLIVTFHGYDITLRAGFHPAMRAYVLWRQSLFRSVSRVVAVSDFIKRRLVAAGCPGDKIERLYIGVDPDAFRRDRAVSRERVILFVGRLVEKKGCAHLIEALRRSSEPASWRLVIIGAGPERRALERLAATAGIEHRFLGEQPLEVVRQWMNRASIFSVPSHTAANGDSEALGIVFLEAQSMELPVVSFDHGGVPEAVEHGRTSLLAREGDTAELSAHLERLMKDSVLRERMGTAGRERVEQSFDIRKCTERLEHLYDVVVAEARGSAI